MKDCGPSRHGDLRRMTNAVDEGFGVWLVRRGRLLALAGALLCGVASCGADTSTSEEGGASGNSGATGGHVGSMGQAGAGGSSGPVGGGSGAGVAGDTGAGNATGAAGSSGNGGSGASGLPGTGGASAVGGRGGTTGAGGTTSGGAGVAGAAGGSGTAGGTGGGGATGGATGAVALDAALLSDCTGTNPIRCTIPVPMNGDYTVTVQLGDASAASVARVQAETYRIVVPQLSLAAGQLSLQTFSVNVRAEQHDGYSAPGQILNLLVDAPAGGPAPHLAGLGFAAAPNIPTIFVAGDSTVCDWDPALATILDPLERGWAQELSQYLTPAIAVANYADSGETAGSFYGKFFPPAKAAMRAGDYLFVQFGHNDQKSATDIATYQANLMKYITDARAKNATPVLFTPVARKGASVANPGFMGLDQQARDLAAAQKVALVDLTSLALAYYQTVPNKSALFATPTEGTHFTESGATQIADLVAGALKSGTLPLRSSVK
jgi:lysophospholipase L1-like esterase